MPKGAMALARHTDFKSVVLVCKTGRRFDSPCPLHFGSVNQDGLVESPVHPSIPQGERSGWAVNF
jgi:hypothetical protein